MQNSLHTYQGWEWFRIFFFMLKYAEENINLGCWSSPPQFKIPCQYKHIWLSWRGRGGKSMAWANVSGDKVGCVTLSLLEALQPWKTVCSVPRSYLGRTLCFFRLHSLCTAQMVLWNIIWLPACCGHICVKVLAVVWRMSSLRGWSVVTVLGWHVWL